MFSTQFLTLNYLLYSPTDAALQFLKRLTPFIHVYYRQYTDQQSTDTLNWYAADCYEQLNGQVVSWVSTDIPTK